MQARAVLWTGPGTVEVGSTEIAQPAAGEVLIENVVSVVSPGSEAEWLSSDASHFVLGTTFPFVPGYSRAGRIAEIGPDVTDWNVGDRVVAGFDNLGRPIGAHASHGLARVEDLERIPDEVSFEQAVFFILGQTAYFVTSLANAGDVSSLAVVGAGPVGNLAVQFARAAGTDHVASLDLEEERRQAALRSGATEVSGSSPEDIERLIAAGGFPGVVDLSGSEAGMNTAIQIAAAGGTVVMSTATAKPMTIEYGQFFVKGLRLVGAFVNADPERARHGTRAYLDHMAHRRIDISELVSEPFAPEDSPNVFRRILEKDRSLIAPMFRWADD